MPGWTDPRVMPGADLTSATTDRTSSMTSSMDSSAFWKFAETSMPR